MILDNLTRALRTQNWTAAGLEFVIVLAGVVAGFQISAWADARADREREAMLVNRLAADFAALSESVDQGLEQCTTGQAQARALSVLLADAPNQDRAEIVQAVGLAIAAPVPAGRSATYVELLASGEMALIRSEELRTALVDFDEQVRRHDLAYESLMMLTISNSGIMFETAALAFSQSAGRLESELTERLVSPELAAASEIMVAVNQQNCRSFNRVRTAADAVLEALETT